MDSVKCIECEKTSQQVPLLELHYQDKKYYVCAQHLPILIHKPDKLAGKLPGAESLKGSQHDC